MTAIEGVRSQLRSRRKAPARPRWSPPQMSDLLNGLAVLAFDATLSHTGWVLLEVAGSRVVVHEKGCINIEVPSSGYQATWDKARSLRAALPSVYMLASLRAISLPHRTVVEAPSVGGGHRTESSLIAGLMISLDGWPVTVSATQVSSVLLGNPRVLSADRKKLIRAAVIRLIPEAAGREWNEHIRDAAAAGLTHLHHEKIRLEAA